MAAMDELRAMADALWGDWRPKPPKVQGLDHVRHDVPRQPRNHNLIEERTYHTNGRLNVRQWYKVSHWQIHSTSFSPDRAGVAQSFYG